MSAGSRLALETISSCGVVLCRLLALAPVIQAGLALHVKALQSVGHVVGVVSKLSRLAVSWLDAVSRRSAEPLRMVAKRLDACSSALRRSCRTVEGGEAAQCPVNDRPGAWVVSMSQGVWSLCGDGARYALCHTSLAYLCSCAVSTLNAGSAASVLAVEVSAAAGSSALVEVLPG